MSEYRGSGRQQVQLPAGVRQTVTPEQIGACIREHLTLDELREVTSACDAFPERVSACSRLDAGRAVRSEAELARWFLGICRRARMGGDA